MKHIPQFVIKKFALIVYNTLWKESLNSDGQQLQQYQQNEQSPQFIIAN